MVKKFNKNSFYTKMLFINVVLIALITIVSSTTISYFANTNSQVEFLKKYDLALNDLHTNLINKHKNFPNILGSLFASRSNYQDLCTLLKTKNPNELSTKLKKNVVDIFNNLYNHDNSCVGIILYSAITNELYQYDFRNRTISNIKLEQSFPDIKPFNLQMISDSIISNLSLEYKKPASHTYGLTGTIYEQQASGINVLGTMLVLYSTNELSTLIGSNHLSDDFTYSVTDNHGNIFFNSADNYSDPNLLLFDTNSYSTLNTIVSPASLKPLNDERYFHSSIYNGRYNFTVNYQIKEPKFGTIYTTHLVIILGVILCLFSILLYIITFNLASKKVNLIKEGMRHIGTSNLKYRIHPIKSKDEFGQIIEGFNRMCDELQHTVEKCYIFELQQKKSELYALQTSIDPHFLYNTLEIIRVHSLQGKSKEVSQMILLLSKIYRNLISQNTFVSLQQELEHCENIMELYQYRYANFDYYFSIGDELLCYIIPRNILQPIIENYFIHGINLTHSDNYIELIGECIELEHKPYIKLTFLNNGTPISPDKCAQLNYYLRHTPMDKIDGHGFALANIHTRLTLAFDQTSGLTVEIPPDSSGFMIHVVFPMVLLNDQKKNG